jgi:hypothetical protein
LRRRRRLKALIFGAEYTLKKQAERLAALPAGYERGELGQVLGLGVDTPCLVIEDSRIRTIVRRGVVAQFLGPRPGKALVCHRCDVPKCVAHDHLFWGTPRDNNRDCVLKGRKRSRHIRMREELAAWKAELVAVELLLREEESTLTELSTVIITGSIMGEESAIH